MDSSTGAEEKEGWTGLKPTAHLNSCGAGETLVEEDELAEERDY